MTAIDEIVGDAQAETFRRDGVVALRGAFDANWIEMLGAAMDADIAAPGPHFARHTKDPDAPAYLEDFWCWRDHAGFETFVRSSPTAAYAARLMGAERINLVMDNWFIREAGSTSRAPFHQDLAYFDFEGTMCVLWLPLEPVSKADGISWVRGSHLWDKLFMRLRFADGHKAGAEGEVVVNGLAYEPPPDVAADVDAYDLAEFDLDLGDAIFFDMRTLHGARAARTPSKTSRRYTLRMTAEDGRIRYRGDWAADERAIFEAAGHRDGDPLDSAFFPRLWP